jgi:curved DNA-binding protein CbpA
MKTVYDVLGVAPDADDRAIRTAFRNSAKVYHPDISGGDQAAEEQFKRITAAHHLIKSPERRAIYDRLLRLRRQRMRRQWKVTIAGCAISAAISAGLVGVIVPNIVNSVPRGSNVNDSLLTKSPAHQFEAIAGTTTEGAHTAGTASIQIPSDTAVDGLRTAGDAAAPPDAEFDGTRAIEAKTANSAEPRSIAVRSDNATTMVGGAAVATAVWAETALAGTSALAATAFTELIRVIDIFCALRQESAGKIL